jgi:carbonic anhydrase
VGVGIGSAEKAVGTRTNRRATDPLSLLIKGNARYVANAPRQRDFSAGRACRARAQAPFAAILGCADSRVAPEFAFDQNPGDLFVVRLAGNLVTDEGLASLEFGAAVLGVRLILVLGHTGCGAVKATVTALKEGNTLPGHISDLVRAMKPGIAPVLKQSNGGSRELQSCAVTANVRYNVERLRHAAPILAGLVEGGELSVLGGVYDLGTGKVELV